MDATRRDALRSLGGAVALSTVPASARAHPDGDSGGADAGTTTTTRSGDFAPIGTLALDGATDAVVEGNTAFVAVVDGFATVDVAEPTSPTLLAERRDVLADRPNGPLDGIYDVAVDGDRLLVAGPAHPHDEPVLEGAALYDVSDPADPSLLRFHETDYPVHNCFLADGVAYLTGNDGERNPLVLVDVASDATPVLARWSVLDANPAWGDVPSGLRVVHDVTVSSDVATLAYWDAGTWLLDVSDPANPRPLGHQSHYGPADLANAPAAQVYELPGNSHYAQRRGSDGLLAVGREAWDVEADEDAAGGPGGIDLYDASDPGDVAHLATIDPPPTPDPTYDGVWTTAHNFDLVGDRLYSSWYQGGVRVHDVSDPANLHELAHFRDTDLTAFWTARTADSCVVASGFHGSGGDLTPGVWTFPRRDEPTTATADGSAPGFGAAAAVGALGVGAAAAWWRGRE